MKRSVPSILASAAKVARAEARLLAPRPREHAQPLEMSRRTHALPRLQHFEVSRCPKEQPADAEPSSEPEIQTETAPQSAHPGRHCPEMDSACAEQDLSSWQCPRLEKLLPKCLQEDRGMMQAWDKGRRLAQSVSLSGPWPGEATVPSRSSSEPRKVDLVNGRCNCPSVHAFCAHLLAATVAAEQADKE
ncbi:unnamed protein product, partial [Symbiodinium pilosum]